METFLNRNLNWDLVAPLLWHLTTLSDWVGNCNLFWNLVTVLFGNIAAFFAVSMPCTDMLIGSGALLLILGLGATLHCHSALCVLNSGAEFSICSFVLRFAL